MNTEIAKLVSQIECWLLSLHVVCTIRMLHAQFQELVIMLHCNSAALKKINLSLRSFENY